MRRVSLVVVAAAAVLVTGCNGSAAPPAQTNAPTAAAEASPQPAATITIPAGTAIAIVLDTTVSSASSRPDEPVRAHVARTISVEGTEAIPGGSALSGVVTDATPAGKVKGRGHVAVRFDAVTPTGGERYTMHTAAVGETAASTKEKDATKIVAPAIGGAVIGGIIGGGKGALVGAAAGGGAGTAVVLSTRGNDVRLGSGARLTLKLTEPLTITVPASAAAPAPAALPAPAAQ